VHTYQFTASMGSTVFSDEYEAGTSDFWLTRPISRTEYYIGKALGGIALILTIISAYTAFSVGIAWFVFGPQQRLDFLVTSLPASHRSQRSGPGKPRNMQMPVSAHG
jgi:ABC-type transport system involved in multi-copper enzyme maturation permease subunit